MLEFKIMRNRGWVLPCIFLSLILTALVSCTEFFTTTLAPWASRSPGNLIPPITVDNVEELVSATENNPDLSMEVLKKIRDAASSASDENKAALQAASLGAAVNASGLAQAVFDSIGKLPDLSGNVSEDEAKKLVLDALSGMTHLEEAGSVLTELLPDPSNSVEMTAFIETANANDLAFAAAVLLGGEAKTAIADDPESFINNFDKDKPATPAEALAVEMALAAASRPEELSGPLKDVLNGLNLIGGLENPDISLPGLP